MGDFTLRVVKIIKKTNLHKCLLSMSTWVRERKLVIKIKQVRRHPLK